MTELVVINLENELVTSDQSIKIDFKSLEYSASSTYIKLQMSDNSIYIAYVPNYDLVRSFINNQANYSFELKDDKLILEIYFELNFVKRALPITFKKDTFIKPTKFARKIDTKYENGIMVITIKNNMEDIYEGHLKYNESQMNIVKNSLLKKNYSMYFYEDSCSVIINDEIHKGIKFCLQNMKGYLNIKYLNEQLMTFNFNKQIYDVYLPKDLDDAEYIYDLLKLMKESRTHDIFKLKQYNLSYHIIFDHDKSDYNVIGLFIEYIFKNIKKELTLKTNIHQDKCIIL